MNDNDGMSVVARRIAAGLAAISAALHGIMLGHAGGLALALLIAGMAVVCLYCACELWRSGSTRAWTLVAAMNLAMVAVHLPLSGGHHVTHVAMEAVVPQPSILTLATALSIVEVVIAVGVLWYRSRGNARAISDRKSA